MSATRVTTSRARSAAGATAGETVFRVESPVGLLTATIDERGRLLRLDFDKLGDALALQAPPPPTPAAARVAKELGEYFAGRRKKFTFPLAPRGTAFQHRVWDELLRIPYGSTMSYREVAARLGNPAATRAVARANATNPIAIVVPCHRVIGADGTLTGYGGGLDRKRRLLELEGALLPMAAPAQRNLYG